MGSPFQLFGQLSRTILGLVEQMPDVEDAEGGGEVGHGVRAAGSLPE